MTLRQNAIWENSYTLWSDAVEKHPNSNTANALLGVVYMELGRDDLALKYLEKAVQILPYDSQSRNNLGIVYGRNDRPEKAINEFLTAIWLQPDDDIIKLNLATFYQRMKEYGKGEEVLNYLIKKNAKDAYLHYRKGMLYKEEGNMDRAVSELETASVLAPRIVNPYEELGKIYLGHYNDVAKAKYYFLKGLEVAPKNSRGEEMRWMFQDIEH